MQKEQQLEIPVRPKNLWLEYKNSSEPQDDIPTSFTEKVCSELLSLHDKQPSDPFTSFYQNLNAIDFFWATDEQKQEILMIGVDYGIDRGEYEFAISLLAYGNTELLRERKLRLGEKFIEDMHTSALTDGDYCSAGAIAFKVLTRAWPIFGKQLSRVDEKKWEKKEKVASQKNKRRIEESFEIDYEEVRKVIDPDSDKRMISPLATSLVGRFKVNGFGSVIKLLKFTRNIPITTTDERFLILDEFIDQAIGNNRFKLAFEMTERVLDNFEDMVDVNEEHDSKAGIKQAWVSKQNEVFDSLSLWDKFNIVINSSIVGEAYRLSANFFTALDKFLSPK